MAQTSEAGGTIQRRPPLVFSFEIYKISKDVTHLLPLQWGSDIVISKNMKGKPLMAGKTLSEQIYDELYHDITRQQLRCGQKLTLNMLK